MREHITLLSVNWHLKCIPMSVTLVFYSHTGFEIRIFSGVYCGNLTTISKSVIQRLSHYLIKEFNIKHKILTTEIDTDNKPVSAIIILIKHMQMNDLGKTLLGMQIGYQGLNMWYPKFETGIFRMLRYCKS